MTDATDWTLEFVNHTLSDGIVLIPSTTELAGNYYFHLVDGTFDISVPKAKRVWAGSGNVHRMGESLVSQTYENRQMTMSVLIVSADKDYIVDGFQKLNRFAYQCGIYGTHPAWSRGYWYVKKQWQGTVDTIFSYIMILAADISPLPNLYGQDGLQFYSNGKYRVPVDITLTVEPAWRDTAPFGTGTAVVSNQRMYFDTDSGVNYVNVLGTNVPGDIPPLVYAVVTGATDEISNASVIHCAVRSRADVANMDLYWTEAEDMPTLQAGASAYADSSCSGGYCARVVPSVVENWRARWYTSYGSAHTGTFRLRARVKIESGVDVSDIGIRATYLFSYSTLTATAFLDVGDGQYKYPSVSNEWTLLDLGKVHLSFPHRLMSDARLYFKLWTKHNELTDYIRIDYVELVPVDDGAGWIEKHFPITDNNYRRAVIDQRYPGVQNIYALQNVTFFCNEVKDYDMSLLTVYPGEPFRIYFNIGGGSITNASTVRVSVYLTGRYLTVA